FNAPRKMVIPGGVIGMLGWIVHFSLTSHTLHTLPATVIAAVLVELLSQMSAVIFKIPVLIFYVSGIITLVPGGMAYNAMRKFVEKDYFHGVQLGAEVMLLAGGIATGLMLSEVLNQIIKQVRIYRMYKRGRVK